jgi:hypothetical protein
MSRKNGIMQRIIAQPYHLNCSDIFNKNKATMGATREGGNPIPLLPQTKNIPESITVDGPRNYFSFSFSGRRRKEFLNFLSESHIIFNHSSLYTLIHHLPLSYL